MSTEHLYKATVTWTGNLGEGTSGYKKYGRAHEISGDGGKEPIRGSADPIYRGDASAYNPEELLIAAISGCHLLWYLHLCADAGVVVVAYADEAAGKLATDADGGGKFAEVTINPRVTITAESDYETALKLHDKAHELCFIANSLNFPVRVAPVIARENE